MNDQGQPGNGWTVVLRRRPVRIVEGRPEGGYTEDYEIVCCDCGDDPDLNYCKASPALQRIRGPYPVAAGITAYVLHARRHPRPGPAVSVARSRDLGVLQDDGRLSSRQETVLAPP